MTDNTEILNLEEIKRVILLCDERHGWSPPVPNEWESDDHKVPAYLALLHSEVSEALEAFRNNDSENFAEELADIFIRLVGMCAHMQIDLSEEVKKKIAKNMKRPIRHGGKRL